MVIQSQVIPEFILFVCASKQYLLSCDSLKDTKMESKYTLEGGEIAISGK